MSVIVTKMDMPKHCFGCGLKIKGLCPRLIKSVCVNDRTIDERCPLKSIDDLIEGLISHKWDDDKGSKAIYNLAIDDAIEYVKEYCEESEDKE